jgi:hypothetical protein
LVRDKRETRWKPRDATVNSTIGVGIVRCRSERCRDQLARLLDRETGAPTGERQAKIRDD